MQATQWLRINPLAIALQFGLGITVLAYMTAHSSGGHINFAVSRLAGVSARAALCACLTSPASPPAQRYAHA